MKYLPLLPLLIIEILIGLFCTGQIVKKTYRDCVRFKTNCEMSVYVFKDSVNQVSTEKAIDRSWSKYQRNVRARRIR